MPVNRDPEMLEQVYDYLQKYIEREGRPPTQREIAEGCFISRGTVMNVLMRLELKGRIERDSGARNIRLIK
jgi:DNA-binding FadR family transcriptional regulator